MKIFRLNEVIDRTGLWRTSILQNTFQKARFKNPFLCGIDPSAGFSTKSTIGFRPASMIATGMIVRQRNQVWCAVSIDRLNVKHEEQISIESGLRSCVADRKTAKNVICPIWPLVCGLSICWAPRSSQAAKNGVRQNSKKPA